MEVEACLNSVISAEPKKHASSAGDVVSESVSRTSDRDSGSAQTADLTLTQRDK